MGNCLVTKSVDTIKSTPRQNDSKFDMEEAPKQLVVDMSKRRNHDDDDDGGITDRTAEMVKTFLSAQPILLQQSQVKRNERAKKGKIMKGEEKTDPDTLYENIKKIPRDKNKNDVMFIINCLKSHFVFYNLSESDL